VDDRPLKPPRIDPGPTPDRGGNVPPAAAGGAGALRDLSRQEADDILRRHDWGILATVGPDGPYAVPVAYGLDGDTLFFATGTGRKSRNIDHDPAICLTVAEVIDGRRWRCAVITGRVEWIDALPARLTAIRAIRAQRTSSGGFSLDDALRLAGARFARVSPIQVSGRMRSLAPSDAANR